MLRLALQWGRGVLHVLEQGFASSFWLGLLFAFALRFVLRWKKEYQLVDAQGTRRAEFVLEDMPKRTANRAEVKPIKAFNRVIAANVQQRPAVGRRPSAGRRSNRVL